MKRITSLVTNFFIYNSVGWMLVSANFAVIIFFHQLSSDLIHTRLPSSDTAQKITVVSSFNPTGNALADLAMLMTLFLNSPALYISNLFYQTFIIRQTENFSIIDKNCTFCWFYISQIGCDVLFIIIQWLVVGVIIKRLCKLVKDS